VAAYIGHVLVDVCVALFGSRLLLNSAYIGHVLVDVCMLHRLGVDYSQTVHIYWLCFCWCVYVALFGSRLLSNSAYIFVPLLMCVCLTVWEETTPKQCMYIGHVLVDVCMSHCSGVVYSRTVQHTHQQGHNQYMQPHQHWFNHTLMNHNWLF
jgi:hypothetical protein